MIKELILKEIENVKEGIADNRVVEYKNFGNKYAVLKDTAVVVVRLKSGLEVTIDITDLILN